MRKKLKRKYILVGLNLYSQNNDCESFIYGIPEKMFNKEKFTNWIKENNYITLYNKISIPVEKDKIIKLYWSEKYKNPKFFVDTIMYANGYYKPRKFDIEFVNDYGKEIYKYYLNLHMELLKQKLNNI